MTAETHALRLRIDGKDADRQMRSLDRQLGGLERSGGRTSSMFSKLGGVIAGIGFAAMAKSMFETNVESERMKGSLSTLLGSMADAQRAFGALNQFASTTPFTMEQSVQAFIKMKSLGLEPTSAALTSFGNTASAMGKDLNQMIEAVADATTGEFERLKEFGIIASSEGENVSFTFQGVTTTVKKNAEEINTYLKSIGENQFAGAMAAQMELLPGRVSNLQDSIGNLWRTIGDVGATSLFINAINWAIEGIDSLSEAIESGFAADMIRVHLEAFVEPFAWMFDAILAERDRVKDTDFWGFLVAEGPMLLLDSLALLPKGVQTFGIIIVELFSSLVENIRLHWNKLGGYLAEWRTLAEKAFEMTWEKIKYQSGEAIEFMIEKFAAFLDGLGLGLTFLPGMSQLGPMLREAAASLADVNVNEREWLELQEEIEGSYKDRLGSIDQQIKILEDQIATNKELARGEIQYQLEQLQAARERLVLAREEVQAEHERTGAVEDANAVIDEYARSLKERVDREEALAKTLKARAKLEDEVEDKLNGLLAKMDPAIARELELAEMREIVNKATLLDIISEEKRQELLAKLPDLLDDSVSAEERMEKAILSGVERLDGAFADLWSNFLSGGELSMDSLRDAFSSMQAELIQAALRPITMKFQAKIEEQTQKYGGLAMGLGMLAGNLGGSLLGGGGQVAQTGAGIGSMIGAIWGPIGSAVGGLIGGLAGGLFDRELHTTLGGPGKGGYRDDAQRITTPFGDVIGYKGGGGYGSFALPGTPGGQIGKAIVSFDENLYALIEEFGSQEQIDAISDALYNWVDSFEGSAVNAETVIASRWEAIIGAFDAGTQKFVTSAYDLEDQITRLGVALATENLVAEGPDFVGDRTREEILALVDLVNGAVGDIGETFQNVIGEMIAAQAALDILEDFTGGDILADFAESMELQNRTLLDTLRASGDEVSRLAGEFDNTLTGAANLAGAIQQRYALELQMLAQIESVIASIETRFQSLDEMIVQSTSTPEENVERLRQKMFDLSEALKTAADPTEIDRLTAQFEQVTRAYWNALSPEQQQALAPDLQAWLGEVSLLAQSRMEEIRAEVLSEGELLREEVRSIMEGIGDPLTLVANEHKIAAEMLQDAAVSLGAGDSGGPVDDVGYPPGLGPGYILPQEVVDVSTSNVQVASEAAAALKREGDSYREATTRLGSAINTAIGRIPTRFDVRVKLDLANVNKSKELIG